MVHTKFQPNMHSRSGENGDFISFAIFSNGSGILDQTKFYYFEVMESADYAACEI